MPEESKHAPSPKMYEGKAEPHYDESQTDEAWTEGKDADAPEPAGQRGEAMGIFRKQKDAKSQ